MVKFETNWFGAEDLRKSMHESPANRPADLEEGCGDEAFEDCGGRGGDPRSAKAQPEPKGKSRAIPARSKPPALY